MTPRGGRDARSHRASGPGLHTSLRAVTGAVTPRGGRDTGVTGPCARPPHRSRIDRTLVRFARPHSTARRSNPTGDRDFGVTGPCARPPHRSRIDRTLVRFARPHSSARRSDPTGVVTSESPGLVPGLLLAHLSPARSRARSHSQQPARRGRRIVTWLPRLNQNVSRPVALLPGSSRLAASGARIVPWRQPGKWLIKCPFASTECLRASPTQCQCSEPPGRRCGLGSDWYGRSRSARWRCPGRAGPGREASSGLG